MAFQISLNFSRLRTINSISNQALTRFAHPSDVAAAVSPAVAFLCNQKRVPYLCSVLSFPVTGATAGSPLVALGAAHSSRLFGGCYIQERVPYFSEDRVRSVLSSVSGATAGAAGAADAAASCGVFGGRYIQRRVPFFSAVPVTSIRRTEPWAAFRRDVTPIHHVQRSDEIVWQIAVAELLDKLVSLFQILESTSNPASLLAAVASEFSHLMRALAEKKANPTKVHLGTKRLVIEKLAVTDDNVKVKVQCAFDVKVVDPGVIMQKQCWNYLADTSVAAAIVVLLNVRLSTVRQLTEPRMQFQILHHIKLTTKELGVGCERLHLTVFDAQGNVLTEEAKEATVQEYNN